MGSLCPEPPLIQSPNCILPSCTVLPPSPEQIALFLPRDGGSPLLYGSPGPHPTMMHQRGPELVLSRSPDWARANTSFPKQQVPRPPSPPWGLPPSYHGQHAVCCHHPTNPYSLDWLPQTLSSGIPMSLSFDLEGHHHLFQRSQSPHHPTQLFSHHQQ